LSEGIRIPINSWGRRRGEPCWTSSPSFSRGDRDEDFEGCSEDVDSGEDGDADSGLIAFAVSSSKVTFLILILIFGV